VNEIIRLSRKRTAQEGSITTEETGPYKNWGKRYFYTSSEKGARPMGRGGVVYRNGGFHSLMRSTTKRVGERGWGCGARKKGVTLWSRKILDSCKKRDRNLSAERLLTLKRKGKSGKEKQDWKMSSPRSACTKVNLGKKRKATLMTSRTHHPGRIRAHIKFSSSKGKQRIVKDPLENRVEEQERKDIQECRRGNFINYALHRGRRRSDT